MGPFGLVLLKPEPCREQPSPFMSTKLPLAPADDGSALRGSWAMSVSWTQQLGHVAPGQPVVPFVSSVVHGWFTRDPALHARLSNCDPDGQGFAVSCQMVAISGVEIRM